MEISINNFIAPPLPARDTIDNIFWAILALSILIFSTFQAYQTGHFMHGIESGAWSGLISIWRLLSPTTSGSEPRDDLGGTKVAIGA